MGIDWHGDTVEFWDTCSEHSILGDRVAGLIRSFSSDVSSA